MSKQVYISADYDENGDRDVVDELIKWGQDNKHKVDFIDMSNVSNLSIFEHFCHPIFALLKNHTTQNNKKNTPQKCAKSLLNPCVFFFSSTPTFILLLYCCCAWNVRK